MAKKLELEPLAQAECDSKLTAVGDALYVLGGKWTLRIVVAMTEGHKRFNEIQRALDNISAKVLASELKNMELNGLVTRKVIPSIPVVIEYELTEYSASLCDVLAALSDWGTRHRDKIRREG